MDDNPAHPSEPPGTEDGPQQHPDTAPGAAPTDTTPTDTTPPGTGPTDAAPAPPPGVQPPGGTPSGGQRSGEREFFDRIRAFGIYRPAEGRWVAGVGAGFARRYGIDPLLARAIIVALVLVTGIGLMLYGLAWAFLPQDDGRIHAQQLLRGDITAGTVGAGLCVLVDVGPGFAFRHVFSDGGWAWGGSGLLLVLGLVALIWWIASGRHRHPGGYPVAGTPGTWQGAPGTWYSGPGTPAGSSSSESYGSPHMHSTATIPGSTTSPSGHSSAVGGTGPGSTAFGPSHGPTSFGPTSPGTGSGRPGTPAAVRPLFPPPRDLTAPSHALTYATLGLALLGGGLVAMLNRSFVDVPGDAAVFSLAVSLGIVALGIVTAGLFGRRAGGLAPIGVLLALVLLVVSVVPANGQLRLIDERTWKVTSRNDPDTNRSIGIGGALVDLSDPRLLAQATPTDPVHISANIGIGQLRVLVPSGAAVEVEAEVGAGDVSTGNGPTPVAGTVSDNADPSHRSTLRYGSSPPEIIVRAKVGLGQVEIVDETWDVMD